MKKSLKKVSALLLAAVMSLGMAMTALAAPSFNPYYEPDPGKATPASADGTTAAVPYIFDDKPLLGGLFLGDATKYRAEFAAPTGVSNYGEVSFDNNMVTYTPSIEVAEQTVKFTVYAGNDADEWTTGGIEFTVVVGPAPTTGSDNANLTSLSYQLDGGEPIEIPDFDANTTEYRVTLPYGTAEGLSFALSGTTDDTNATTAASDKTTAYVMRDAKLTVTAENGATTKEYIVHFHIAAPNIDPMVEIDGKEYKDGDTVYLEATETKYVSITIGMSEDNPNGSVGSEHGYSDDYSTLYFAADQAGVYPNIKNSGNRLNFVDSNVTEGTIVDIHIKFYRENTTSWDKYGYTPYKTITLHVVCGSEPEGLPAIQIDYDKEQLTGFENDAVYIIDGTEVQPVDGCLAIAPYMGKEISIVKKGGAGTADSPAQKLTIPARPAAPTGVSGGKGVINGVNGKMEYRRVGTDTWTPISGDSVTGLSKGNYEVRVQGTDGTFASEAAIVTVTKKGGSSSGGSSSGGSSSSKDEPTYTPKVEENEGGTASVSPKKPEKGDTVTVTPEAEDGYVPEKVIVRDENGDKIKVTEEKDGTFTFTQPEGAVTIEVIYAEEEPTEQLVEQPEDQPAEQPSFSDVKETDWYYEAVQTVSEKGFMGGIAADTFAPEQNTTRGMIAAILYRMSGESYPDEASVFRDVKEGVYYNPAVVWGTDHSVLRGYDDGLFRPDRTITREELALLIYNFAKYQGLDVSNIEGMGIYEFTDFEEISDWSMIAVRDCVNAGLLSGRDDGSFDPKGMATRAEVASVLQRLLEK